VKRETNFAEERICTFRINSLALYEGEGKGEGVIFVVRKVR
jgi:hypothetical protein